ncbi:MAG: GerMN domain-containing protein [Clostridia bacterium]|nr:GerMN domain-containing protein [Clostridia bacterium]
MVKDKNKLKIIFGVLAIIIAVGGFFLLKWVKENNQEQAVIGEEYTPEAEITEEQERQTIVSLYFPSKDERKLTPEARLIDVKELVNMPYEKLMNLLMEGPKNEKLDKIIPKETKVLRTFTENDVLVFDLSKDFLNYDTEKENEKDNLIKSIVNTVTELTEINGVKFLIDGAENDQFNETYRRSTI